MGATITYTNLNPDSADTQLITLQKILQSTAAGGVSNVVLSGSGAPTTDPGVVNAIYVDLNTGDFYYWNDTTEAWV